MLAVSWFKACFKIYHWCICYLHMLIYSLHINSWTFYYLFRLQLRPTHSEDRGSVNLNSNANYGRNEFDKVLRANYEEMLDSQSACRDHFHYCVTGWLCHFCWALWWCSPCSGCSEQLQTQSPAAYQKVWQIILWTMMALTFCGGKWSWAATWVWCR